MKRENIISAYTDYVLTQGKRPASVYAFTKELEVGEEQFYLYFPSFEALEMQVVSSLLEETIFKFNDDETFQNYSARERILAVYFGWVELLTKNRSLVMFISNLEKRPLPLALHLKKAKEVYIPFAKELVDLGLKNEEIQQRPFVSDKYAEALWMQLLFIYHFWQKDTSTGFEKTDEAIERSTNLAFDLMHRSALDQAFDFAKFLYQAA
jgi:AcrR family transcriptional regulator